MSERGAGHDPLLPGEPWTDLWRAELASLDDDERARWEVLLRCAAGATGPRPPAHWRDAARAAALVIGVDGLRGAVSAAFARVARAGPSERDRCAEPAAIAEGNQLVLRGLVWVLMLEPWPDLPRFLGELCTACMMTVPDVGPRAQRVANACVAGLGALAASPDEALRTSAVTHLARARARISDRATRVALSTALASAAADLGLGVDELEEQGVPDYGFRDGALTLDCGGWRLQLRVDGLAVLARWTDPSGRTHASAPDHVQAEHAEELAEARSVAKDAASILAATAARIDAFQRVERSWPLATWRARYLSHGLVGTIAQRARWEADGVELLLLQGDLTDAMGRRIDLAPDTTIRPWRPARMRDA